MTDSTLLSLSLFSGLWREQKNRQEKGQSMKEKNHTPLPPTLGPWADVLAGKKEEAYCELDNKQMCSSEYEIVIMP